MNSKIHNNEYSESEIELAKKIACAAISHRARISYAHCWRTYIVNNPNIAEYWKSLARKIKQDNLDSENQFSANLGK
jgi:hypothetical protein